MSRRVISTLRSTSAFYIIFFACRRYNASGPLPRLPKRRRRGRDCPHACREKEKQVIFKALAVYTKPTNMYVCMYALAYSAIYSCPSELTPMSGAQGGELQV